MFTEKELKVLYDVLKVAGIDPEYIEPELGLTIDEYESLLVKLYQL